MMKFLTTIYNISVSAFQWWISELKMLLPDQLKRKSIKKKTLFFRFNPEGVEISSGGGEQVGVKCEEDREAIGNVISRLNSESQIDMPVELILSDHECMTVHSSYPEQAIDRLEGLSSIEILRSMPFSEKDVYSQSELVARDTQKKQITVEHGFARREDIDSYLSRLSALNLSITAIRPAFDSPINLLPKSYGSDERKTLWIKYGTMVAVCLASFIFCVFSLSVRQERILTGLSDKLTTAKLDASLASKTAREAEKTETRLTAIRTLKKDHPSALMIWNELSETLPDNAWVTELKISEANVQIAGYAELAAPLVNMLEGNEYFYGAEFTSPVTLDRRQSKERYTITFLIDKAGTDIVERQIVRASP